MMVRNADRPQQVKVPELIDNVLALYGHKLRSLGVAIETRYDADLPVNAFPGLKCDHQSCCTPSRKPLRKSVSV
jgi:hypothetical protein